MDEDKLKEVKKDAKLMEKIGEIEVKLYRASTISTIPKDMETPRDMSVGLKKLAVHEKALKGQAKSHQVS